MEYPAIRIRFFTRPFNNFIVMPFNFCRELKEQSNLEDNLCKALKVQRGPSGEISVLKDRGYVLTQDYLLKMIGIHERRQCGMPVIITGETGVGKTFLLETLNDLYNFSQQQKLEYWRLKLKEFLSTYTQLPMETEERMSDKMKSLPDKICTQSLLNVHNWFKRMEKQNIVDVFSLIEFSHVQRKIPQLFDQEVYLCLISFILTIIIHIDMSRSITGISFRKKA